ncbi:MAG: DNA-processing protein DprA [Agriterribacter sp.]
MNKHPSSVTMNSDILYQIALTIVPQIGDVHAATLLQHFETAKDIFSARKAELEKIAGIGTVRAKSIKSFNNFSRAEEEIAFIEKYKIKVLTSKNSGYPTRLLNCYDAPSVLYYKGNVDLNKQKIISVIGTRNHTDYGKDQTHAIIEELASHDVIIVSGLAYGIDADAHRAALKNNLSTVGVLAHGLDRIYPPAHTLMAKEIAAAGGLLTDFMSGTQPDKQNFPKRNRIVAGMADATLVIETGLKGGSMITAELANTYNRDVFALPGKTTDSKSAGCNYLIKTNKAALVSCGKDIIDFMNWLEHSVTKPVVQKQLFIELSSEEKKITDILMENLPVHIDEIYQRSQLSSSTVAAAILNLELQGVIASLPGKLYKLL